MDPYAVLGVPAGASEREVYDAYRRLAKRLHPDVAARADGSMATVNVAYDLLRASFRHRRGGHEPARGRSGRPGARVPAGHWLPEAVRHALGGELLHALLPREDVAIVTPVAMWASPRALLAVTDRRLLWLLDDAPLHRVRFLRFSDVEHVELRASWPRRREALHVRTTQGRRFRFTDLHPATADAIVRRVAGGACG